MSDNEVLLIDSVKQLNGVKIEHNESYFELVWRRCRRSKASIFGAALVVMLILMSVFAEFFSPNPIDDIYLESSFIPPQQVHFFDENGKFYLIPFVYNFGYEVDVKTFQVHWAEDKTTQYQIHFFVQGWEYKLLGLFPSKLHLFGVDEGGTIYLLGTDKLGRDLFGKACEAGRVSLTMSVFGTIISVVFGSV